MIRSLSQSEFMTTKSAPPKIRTVIFAVLFSGTSTLLAPAMAQADDIRSEAVVNLTFDEATGAAYDSSASGRSQDSGTLVNGPSRVESPFPNQAGKRAILFDAARKQLIQIPDSADTDRSAGVSVSFLYLNLHPLSDNEVHGLFAKRDTVSNYGVNYQGDNLQLYINPGDGYRIAHYSLKDTLGSRQRAFVTAVFEPGDAPSPDDDADRDDLRVRLYVNGQPATPNNAGGNVIAGDAWLLNVDGSKLLNNAPLTIGSTGGDAEPHSCVIDEFSLFPRALSPVEAALLFVEVAGPDAESTFEQDRNAAPAPSAPAITSLSLSGLQIANTTRLIVNGRNLGAQAQLDLPIAQFQQTVVEATPERLTLDITLPADTASGFHPLRVVTPAGVSNSITVATDHLPQVALRTLTAEQPLTLPAAVSGRISGPEQVRVYFAGTAKQRVIAEVESRRLGAQLDPVLELKSARGTPLSIEWAQTALRGDARGEWILPEDGTYYVELHDLEYNARGQNAFRLRIGDLPSVDAVFPPAVARGADTAVSPIGIGIDPAAQLTVANTAGPRSAVLASAPEALKLGGPFPAVRLSDATELVEVAQDAGALQSIDATFPAAKHVPIAMNGRLSAENEKDRYLLTVTPGTVLSIAVAAQAMNSPLDGQLAVLSHPNGALLASSDDRPNTRDPGLDFTVPANVTQIAVEVSDLERRGGPDFLYRLIIKPAGQPDFQLNIETPKVEIPADGNALLEVKVTRMNYGGPLRVRIEGEAGWKVTPAEIVSELPSGIVYVTLSRESGAPASSFRRLQLVAESVNVDPPIRRTASVDPGARLAAVPAFDDVLPVAAIADAHAKLNITQLPPALLKGLPANFGLQLSALNTPSATVRLTLQTKEAPRPIDPNDGNKGNKPLIASVAEQYLASATAASNLAVSVPLDVAEGAIDCVIRADVVPHAYSDKVLATVYSDPFRLPVQDAVALSIDEPTLQLVGGRVNKITGKLPRAASFTSPVVITINGLPEGYFAPAVAVPNGQEPFELPIFATLEAQAKDLPNIVLHATTDTGLPIMPDRALALKVAPPAAEAAK